MFNHFASTNIIIFKNTIKFLCLISILNEYQIFRGIIKAYTKTYRLDHDAIVVEVHKMHLSYDELMVIVAVPIDAVNDVAVADVVPMVLGAAVDKMLDSDTVNHIRVMIEVASVEDSMMMVFLMEFVLNGLRECLQINFNNFFNKYNRMKQ